MIIRQIKVSQNFLRYNVKTDCGKDTNLKHPLSIAIGIADVSDDKFESEYNVVSLADKRMYENNIKNKISGQ